MGVTPKEKLMDDRYAEDIVLSTPGGFVGHSRYDTAGVSNQYPIIESDFADTFELLYPKRPNFNQYTECSSRGTTCPNGCSGHGRCLDNSDVNPNQYMSYNYPNDQMWDQMRTQSCKCDRGYTGYDCNSRICPFGDDPTSDCGENSAGDVQLVVTKSPHDSVTNSERYFTLSFTDMFGGTFTTRPILDHAPSCALAAGEKFTPCPEVQYALMDLPNFAIPEVEVDAFPITEAGAGAGKTSTSMYTIQFTDSSNAGKQNTLTCELVSDSTGNGAQPKYQSVSACKVYNVGGPEWFDESGTALELDLKATFA